MPDVTLPRSPLVLSIEQDQRIDLAADGTTVRGYETYIREYVGMLESGLMARMSNAAYKILHALALRARILGDPRRPGAEAEFQELERLGIVTTEDKGLLFCFPSREQLMDDTGIRSVHTVDAALDELAEMKIVKRITPAQPRLTRGLFGSNVYIIHPESFIGKFGTGDGKHKVLPERTIDSDGEQKLLPVKVTGSSLRISDNCPLKNNNQQQKEKDLEIITQHFAASIGIEQYTLEEKEGRKIVALLVEGYTTAQICAGITRSIEKAAQSGRLVRRIAYCIPAVRENSVQVTERKAEMGSPQPNRKRSPNLNTASVDRTCRRTHATAVPGQPHAVILSTPDLEELAKGDAELRDLLEVVQERNPGRTLQKSDVRAWQMVAERFQALATVRDTTPIGLLMQAILKAIGSHSDREGYLAPRLAERILEEWQCEQMEKQPAGRAESTANESSKPVRAVPSSHGTLLSIQTSEGKREAAQIWETALAELKGQMTKATFDTWVKATGVVDVREGETTTLVIGTRNPYAVEWLEHRLQTIIQRTVVGIVGRDVRLQYTQVE